MAGKHCECCTRRAYYNYAGSGRRYCSIHKLNGMVNVTSARCKAADCEKGRVYNYPGLTSAYCNLHRKVGMVNCSRPICKESGCTTFAQYGYNNRRDYCYNHKENMMDKHVK